jgi:hypothetical protein
MRASKGKKVLAILLGISIAILIVMHVLEGELQIVGLNH